MPSDLDLKEMTTLGFARCEVAAGPKDFSVRVNQWYLTGTWRHYYLGGACLVLILFSAAFSCGDVQAVAFHRDVHIAA